MRGRGAPRGPGHPYEDVPFCYDGGRFALKSVPGVDAGYQRLHVGDEVPTTFRLIPARLPETSDINERSVPPCAESIPCFSPWSRPWR